MYKGPLKPTRVHFCLADVNANLSAFFGFKESRIISGRDKEDNAYFWLEVTPYEGEALSAREEIGRRIVDVYKAWYCNYTFTLVDDLVLFLMDLHMEQSEIYWMQQFGVTEWTK